MVRGMEADPGAVVHLEDREKGDGGPLITRPPVAAAEVNADLDEAGPARAREQPGWTAQEELLDEISLPDPFPEQVEWNFRAGGGRRRQLQARSGLRPPRAVSFTPAAG